MVYTMQAVKIVVPVCISWPNLTPVNLFWGDVTRSLNMQGLRNRAARVYRIFNTYVCTLLQLFTDVHLFQDKTLRHVA